MNKAWPMVPLGEVLRPVSRPEPVDHATIYRVLGAHWYAKGLYVKEIKPGSQIQASKLFRVEHGDFVYNRLFAWKGSFAIATEENHGCYVSNEFPVFTINRDRAKAKYLWGYFSRASAWDEALSLSSGGTPTSRNRLKEEKLLAMKIPLPSLNEQQRIVARIDELASKIEETRQLRRQAVEKVGVLFLSALESVFEKDGAEEWPRKKLIKDGLTTVVAGQHILAGEYSSLGEGTPYLTGPAAFGRKVPQITHWTLVPKAMSLPGDILLTVKGAGVGKINFAPDVECAIGRQIMAIRPSPGNLMREFLYFFLDHKFEHFRSIATATTVPGFKKSDVENLEIPVPPIHEQRQIVAYLDDLQATVDSLKRLQAETAAELDAMLPSILDKAFKGEL